jgi:hypothetical protein
VARVPESWRVEVRELAPVSARADEGGGERRDQVPEVGARAVKRKHREMHFEIHEEKGIDDVFRAARTLILQALRGGSVALILGRLRRTLDQNAKLWPMLGDISKQVLWHVVGVNGRLEEARLTDHEWKDVFTAALKQQRMVPGIDGGHVYLGGSTSKMDKVEFSQLIELIYAFGSARNVVWSEPAKKTIAEMQAKKERRVA